MSMDDVAASGSVALEEDKAGCLFCIGYVRWHGRDRPPKALWKASALWWLGRSGRASMGAEDIDGIDAQYGCCRQGGCDVRDLWSCILLCQNVSLNVFFCIMFCHRTRGAWGASFPSPGLAEPPRKRQRVPNVFSATLNG